MSQLHGPAEEIVQISSPPAAPHSTAMSRQNENLASVPDRAQGLSERHSSGVALRADTRHTQDDEAITTERRKSLRLPDLFRKRSLSASA